MTGRERIMASLELREPDRVPVWIHAMNEASIINIGKHFTDDLPELKQINFMDIEEQMQLLNAIHLIHEELEIDGITSMPMLEETDLDEKRFKDEWGAVFERNPYGLAYPIEPIIKNPEDLKDFQRPHINSDESLFLLEMNRTRFGESLSHFFMIGGVFTQTFESLRSMDELLMDMVDNPGLVHDLFRIATDYNLELIDAIAGGGAEIAIIEDDLAYNSSTLMSPAHFDEFVRPYNQELVDRGHERGMKVIHHSDGNIWPILDSMLEMDYDGLNPLQPQGGMDLKKVKDYCGDRLCLLGNIDCSHLLSFGSEEEVEEAVVQAIEDAAPGGGYIVCSSNTIHPGVKPENFLAMVRAAKQHGEYNK
jgi:uroporphyrinogen decarboxylase